jgi:hypothetical protein
LPSTRFERFAVGLVGAERLLLRQKEIARETVANSHFVADGAEIFDAFKKDDLHGRASLLNGKREQR